MSNGFLQLPEMQAGAVVTVATAADLPTDVAEGAIRYVRDTDTLYTFDGLMWHSVSGGGGGGGVTIGSTVTGGTPGRLLNVDTAGNIGQGDTTAAAATDGLTLLLWAQDAGTGNQNGGDIVLMTGTATGSGKGGALQASTGGNARGSFAVDWQTTRFANQNVASGDFSVISGGDGNESSGTAATVIGGQSNSASAAYAASIGGHGNSAAHAYSIAGGAGALTTADGDFVLGNVDTASSSAANVHLRMAGDVSDLHIGHMTDQSAVSGASNQLQLHTIFANHQSRAVGIKAPDTLAASYTLTLPPDTGTSGQVLSTNGAGVTAWQTSSTPTVSLQTAYDGGSVIAIPAGHANATVHIDNQDAGGNSTNSLTLTFNVASTIQDNSYGLAIDLSNGGNAPYIKPSSNGQFLFAESANSNSNFYYFMTPNLATTIPWMYPDTQGITGAILVNTDGAGTLGWTSDIKIKASGVVHFANMSTTTRNALPSPEAGDTIYNTTTAALEFYDGTAWN